MPGVWAQSCLRFCQFHLHRWHSRRVWPLLCAGGHLRLRQGGQVPTLDRSTKYRCAGPVRCMGEDCLSVDQEASTDFAKAAALLQAAQFMTQDTDCEDVTGHDNLYCRAFTGQPSECKVAVGGVQNCCKN